MSGRYLALVVVLTRWEVISLITARDADESERRTVSPALERPMTMPAKDWATGRAATSPTEPYPIFASVEEEAAFWDTHSFTEFARRI